MIKVDFIGGVDELYMISWSGDLDNPKAYKEHLTVSLEEVQSMLKQFKKFLKPEQWDQCEDVDGD
jgi:hypothetical protein